MLEMLFNHIFAFPVYQVFKMGFPVFNADRSYLFFLFCSEFSTVEMYWIDSIGSQSNLFLVQSYSTGLM